MLRTRTLHVVLIMLAAASLLVACGGFSAGQVVTTDAAVKAATRSSGLSSDQEVAAKAAVKALSVVYAATEVGVTYQQYGPLLINAQAAVNDAAMVLPDGELVNEIPAAMEAFADAQYIWSEKMQGYELWTTIQSNVDLAEEYNQSHKL